MRILFFIEDLGSGGKERRLVELIRGLSKSEHIKMEVILMAEQVHYSEIFASGIKVHYLKRRLKRDPLLFIDFYRYANAFSPDFIHVWGNMVAIYAIPTKLLLRKVMINSQITDAPIYFDKGILNHKLTFPFSDLLIANSEAGLIAYNAPKNKSIVIYNGFDCKRLNNLEGIEVIRNKYGIRTKYVVGMVATFSKMKDYKTYINAAIKVLDNNDDVTFLCIGAEDNPYDKKSIPDKYVNKILFLGQQKNVESIMNICDIGVLATYTEGISNALLEFSALGKPVVTNFGGGNEELVVQDKTGFLVSQRSPNDMAEKIDLLLNDESKRKMMGEAGRNSILKKFAIEKMIDGYVKVYNQLYEKKI